MDAKVDQYAEGSSVDDMPLAQVLSVISTPLGAATKMQQAEQMQRLQQQQMMEKNAATWDVAPISSGVVTFPQSTSIAVDPPAIDAYELTVLVRRLRTHALIVFFFGILTCMSPGTAFCPPIDLVLFIATFSVIMYSTEKSRINSLFDSKAQRECCGIRHAYGLAIASMVFLSILSAGRLVTSYYYFENGLNGFYDMNQFTFAVWASGYRTLLALDLVAAIGTGVTMHSLLMIASLTAPSRYSQCMTYGAVIYDPKNATADATYDPSRRHRCPAVMRFLIAGPAVAVIIFSIVRMRTDINPSKYCGLAAERVAFYSQYVLDETENEACCKNVEGYTMECVRTGERFFTTGLCSCAQSGGTIDTCNSNSDAFYCLNDNEFGCPNNVTVFLPDPGYQNGFNASVSHYFKKDTLRKPVCAVESGTFCSYDGYRAWGNGRIGRGYISCPQSSYTCTEVSRVSSKYCAYFSSYPNVTLP